MSSRLGFLAPLLTAAAATAQTFTPATHHEMGEGPVGLVVADLSGDGLLDVATANQIEVTASVRLGDGAGGLGAETSFPLPGLIETLDLAAGDVTGDAVPDLVASGSSGNSNAIVVLRALGDGTYSPVTYTFPCCVSQMGHLQLADFNGDGQLDLVGGSQYDSLIYVAKNDAGALLFSYFFPSVVTPCADLFCIEAVTGLDAADFDEDGDLDFACTNLLDQSLVTFANSGLATFALSAHKEPHVPLNELLLRDIDEDGHVDALASDGTQGVHFMAGDGTGAFADPISSPVNGGIPPFVTGPSALALADVTGDGRLDVAAAHSFGATHEVLVAPGNGAGSFGPAVSVGPIDKLATRVEAADLDRDGRADLVVTEPGTSLPAGDTIALLMNTTKPAPPWNDTGFALAGAVGSPWLMTFGPLTAGSTVELSLSGALPGAPAVLVLGLSELYAPFKGGTLVPHPDFVLGPFVVQPDGGLALSGHWPLGVPSDVLIGVQWWIVDAGGPKGLASSNGVLGITP
jgi:hypothetical protein